MFYPGIKDFAGFECEFIERTRLRDGSWNITWNREGCPDEWAVSKNWWKSNGIITNMLYLKGFGKM